MVILLTIVVLIMHIVGFSGGLSTPSRTYGLVEAIVGEISKNITHAKTTLIDLSEIASAFGSALYREELSLENQQILKTIEAADILVVASPVYRAAYPGLFKHVFDLVDRGGLERKAVILGANGGSAHHALIVESHLRPLFSSLGAYTVPTGIYSQTSDFENYTLTNQATLARVGEAVSEALQLHSNLIAFPENRTESVAA